MFDGVVDAWYVWIGLSIASVALFGVVGSLPTTPPPDATGLAETVDRVAAGDSGVTAEHAVAATAVRVAAGRVALRNGAGTAHADVAFGPVTPAFDSRLSAVLHGSPPARRFDSPDAFRAATERARNATPSWRPVDGPVVVRRVSWNGVDATLVGA